MLNRTNISLITAVILVICSVSCSSGEAQENANASTPPSSANAPNQTSGGKPVATPARNFTAADIAKLKWIEGTWRGMDGANPFYERYKLEGTTLIVESLKEDGSLDGEPGRFELKDGEFGKGEGEKRSAASSITDNSVQFVPGPQGRGNSFRFERKPHGWDAVLEWPAAANKPAGQKIYKMEPWTPEK